MNKHIFLFWFFFGMSRFLFGQTDSLLFQHLEKYELYDEQLTFATLHPEEERIHFRVLFRTEPLNVSLTYLQLHPVLLFSDSLFVSGCIAQYVGEINEVQTDCLTWLDTVPKPDCIQRIYDYALIPIKEGEVKPDTLAPEIIRLTFDEWYRLHQKKLWKSVVLAAIIPGSAKLYRGETRAGRTTLFMHLAMGAQLTEGVIKRGWTAPIVFLNAAFLLGTYSVNVFDAVHGLKEKKREATYHYYKTLAEIFQTDEVHALNSARINLKALESEKRWLNTASDSLKTRVLFEKMTEHLRDQEPEKAIKSSYRIEREYLSDSLLMNYHWNLGLAYLAVNNESSASYNLTQYARISTDTTTSFLLFNWLSLRNYPAETNDLVVEELIKRDSLFLLLKNYPEQDETTKRYWKSYLLPGSDLLLQGNIKEGMVALGLNGLVSLSICSMLRHHLWINTVFWGSNLLGKFYLGQARLAHTKDVEKRARIYAEKKRKFADEYKKISLRYPLNYRL